jgi:hypothetical protein
MRQGLARRRATWWLIVTAVVVSLAAAISSGHGAAQVPVQGSAHPGPLELLMFEEPGCPWCRRWQAEVGVGYPHSAEGKRAPLRIVQVHAPLPAGIQFATPVRMSPTFVLVARGREIGRITGYPGADFFWPMLEDLLRKPEAASAATLDVPEKAP